MMCDMGRLRAIPLVTAAMAIVALLSGCHGPVASSSSPSSSSSSGTNAKPTRVASPTPTATAAGVPTCTRDQLNIVYSPTDNTAGHAHGVLTFANTSQQACSLTGYATVAFDNPEAEEPMGQPASHDPSEPTVAAIASVDGFSTADLTITNAGFVDGCTLVTATALIVTPPGLTQAQNVPIAPTPACQNDGIGLLAVSSNYIPPGS